MSMSEEEFEKSKSILRRNRHRSFEPRTWYGPDPEPCPPGENCDCGGCETYRIIEQKKQDQIERGVYADRSSHQEG